ncbi:MAG: type II toxin-antitoxin system RelE/ParE family toxin [Polyangia bacterium]
MIQSFKTKGTEDLYNGIRSKAARKACPEALRRTAVRKLDQIDSASIPADLRVPPGNRLEALSGERKGQHSVRVNDQYRICFRWHRGDAYEVEIVDYHR